MSRGSSQNTLTALSAIMAELIREKTDSSRATWLQRAASLTPELCDAVPGREKIPLILGGVGGEEGTGGTGQRIGGGGEGGGGGGSLGQQEEAFWIREHSRERRNCASDIPEPVAAR